MKLPGSYFDTHKIPARSLHRARASFRGYECELFCASYRPYSVYAISNNPINNVFYTPSKYLLRPQHRNQMPSWVKGTHAICTQEFTCTMGAMWGGNFEWIDLVDTRRAPRHLPRKKQK